MNMLTGVAALQDGLQVMWQQRGKSEDAVHRATKWSSGWTDGSNKHRTFTQMIAVNKVT